MYFLQHKTIFLLVSVISFVVLMTGNSATKAANKSSGSQSKYDKFYFLAATPLINLCKAH
jgi:hypothetical protein